MSDRAAPWSHPILLSGATADDDWPAVLLVVHVGVGYQCSRLVTYHFGAVQYDVLDLEQEGNEALAGAKQPATHILCAHAKLLRQLVDGCASVEMGENQSFLTSGQWSIDPEAEMQRRHRSEKHCENEKPWRRLRRLRFLDAGLRVFEDGERF